MASPRQQRFTASERRREVARLYYQRHTQQQIAALIGCSQQQVSRDIKAILAEYRCERGQHIEREIVDLDQMEQATEMRFAETGEREWLSERRAIKERRAKLLGLDAHDAEMPVIGRIILEIGGHASGPPAETEAEGRRIPPPAPDGD